MPTHRAKFSQPGPALNPLGVKLPGPVEIELFIPDKGKKWSVREVTSGNVVKHAGVSNTPGQARYAAAVLFDVQLTPWSIDGAPDPHADRVHIHLDGATPSLCGSRYHQREDPLANVLILPELRAGIARVPPGAALCAVCVSSIDRTLQQGDAIRNTAGGRGLVVGAMTADEVLVQWEETGETSREKRAALTFRLSEQLR
jgi:hypothetical protein